MRRCSVWLPIAVLLLYCIGSIIVGPVEKRDHWFYGEVYGPAEWGAAIAFFVAGLLALRLAVRSRRDTPTIYVAYYVCFALAGFVMAGEELSWGQHSIGFESPEWFEHENKQAEFNLHNLAGDKPSSLLRRAAELGFPVLLIIAPLAHMRWSRTAYVRGAWHWPYWTLPRWEAVTATLLGNLCRPIYKTEVFGIQGADELAETLWGLACVFWVLALSERVLGDAKRSAEIAPSVEAPDESLAGEVVTARVRAGGPPRPRPYPPAPRD